MNTVKTTEKQQTAFGIVRDEPNDFPANGYNANPITNSESFKYKASIAGKTSNANPENGENTEQEDTKTKTNCCSIKTFK